MYRGRIDNDRLTFSELKPVIFFLTSRVGEVLISITWTEGYKASSSSMACTVRGEPPIGGGFGPTNNSVLTSIDVFVFWVWSVWMICIARIAYGSGVVPFRNASMFVYPSPSESLKLSEGSSGLKP